MKLILPIRDDLKLRTLEPSDAGNFYKLIRKNDVYLREWLGWLDEDKSVADTEKYIQESNKRYANKEGLDFGIFYKNQHIGGIGLFPLDLANKKTSIAYWLGEEFQGQGIMTDSLKTVIAYAFKEMGLNRIEITCATQNTKSSAIPRKLGFTFEGITRQGEWLYDHFVDLEVYSLLATEQEK